MVSAEKLKKEFNNFETGKYNELSADELDRLIESLVLKMFKGFKKGKIYENPDINDAADELEKCYNTLKYKFKNVNAVIIDRKFRYVFNACITADEVVTNQNLRQLNMIHQEILDNLSSNIKLLNILLMLYYDNYSNSAMLNDLMFNLSAADDIPLTFEIHDKYTYGDKFSFNYPLMKDLDRFIAGVVDVILYLLDNAENMFYDDIDAEKGVDNAVESVKADLKYLFGKANDFETVIISENGYDDVLIEKVDIIKESIAINERYFDLKNQFMDLYDGNAFKEIAAKDFEICREINADVDFDDFMKKKPKYDLKKCEFIKPEISGF